MTERDALLMEFRYLARFERDSTGYRLPEGFSPDQLNTLGNDPHWVETTIGITSDRVWVNLARAYLVEPLAGARVESYEEGEPERITEPDDPEHHEAVRRIAEEHGLWLSDWKPTFPERDA